MTDLFFRIAERALGLAPTIQPMIAPLFAPTSYANDKEMLDILATEEQGSQSSDTSFAAPTTPANNTHLKHTIQPLAPAIVPNEAFVSNQVGIPPISPIPTGPPIPTVPSIERRTAVTVYPEIELRSAQTSVSTPEEAFSAQSRYTMPIKNTQMAPIIDSITQHELPVIERPGNNQAERRSTPLTRQQAAPRSTETVMNMRRRLPHDAVRESRNGVFRAKPAEHYTSEKLQEGPQINPATPAVHVTIGRIEVRANPVSPTQVQPQSQHAMPKALSLDEYLKQSEKGGR